MLVWEGQALLDKVMLEEMLIFLRLTLEEVEAQVVRLLVGALM